MKINGITISGGGGGSGTSGSSGTSGISGSSGTSGVNGFNGTSGTSGINGSSGTSGVNGGTGSSGTSGTSGVSPSAYGSFGITIDGNGSVITTGTKGYVEIPYSGTITGWTLVGNDTGSIVIDVWKTSYAGAPPVVGNSIAGTSKPTMSSVKKNQDLTISGWGNTSVSAGDIVGFNVDSVSTLTRVNLSIKITKS